MVDTAPTKKEISATMPKEPMPIDSICKKVWCRNIFVFNGLRSKLCRNKAYFPKKVNTFIFYLTAKKHVNI
jgi:hypothetical protein